MASARILGGQQRIMGRLLVGELEDERDVEGRARPERFGQHAQMNPPRLAERDRIPSGEATARVHQHGVAGGYPLDGALDVRLGILRSADDDDMKPEARQTAPQPRQRLPAKPEVAGARIGGSDDERQPH